MRRRNEALGLVDNGAYDRRDHSTSRGYRRLYPLQSSRHPVFRAFLDVVARPRFRQSPPDRPIFPTFVIGKRPKMMAALAKEKPWRGQSIPAFRGRLGAA